MKVNELRELLRPLDGETEVAVYVQEDGSALREVKLLDKRGLYYKGDGPHAAEGWPSRQKVVFLMGDY